MDGRVIRRWVLLSFPKPNRRYKHRLMGAAESIEIDGTLGMKTIDNRYSLYYL